MNSETVERLSKELSEPEGFSSYKEVHEWLTSCCEVKVAYRTVHQWARYRLKGKLQRFPMLGGTVAALSKPIF